MSAHHDEKPHCCQTASSGKCSMVFLAISFLIGFLFFLGVGWIVFPKLLYSKKIQPIDFDHKLHTAEAGGCESCHSLREDGTFTGIPGLDNCLQCHEEQIGNNPEEQKLVEDYVKQNKEIPWLVYSRQPDCVFFSHAAHTKMGKIECKECHGDKGESEKTVPYEENRITGYSRDIDGRIVPGLKLAANDRMKMTDCGDCHKKHGENNACFVCHK
ncbi:MAG: menaquinone reductase multiheme cytochrome c subunit QrcA [Pseudomonadota bacterium]